MTAVWFLNALTAILKRIPFISVEIPFSWTGELEDERMILNRTDFTNTSTIGELLLDGVFQCFSLELSCRKQDGVKNCIPAGKYEVQITYSTRFKKDMPLLVGVPGFDGIRIHPGNSSISTIGCILVGKTKTTDWIGDSVLAFNDLYAKIEDKLRQGKLYIEIAGCS